VFWICERCSGQQTQAGFRLAELREAHFWWIKVQKTIKPTCVHRLRSCMPWPDWYQHPLQPHNCHFCICPHSAQDIWIAISPFSSHACLDSPPGASSLPSLLLPSRPCPAPVSGCAETVPISVIISQTRQGALAPGTPHPPDGLAREGATMSPLGSSICWGQWSPGIAEPLHWTSATRALFQSWYQTTPDLVDGEEGEVFCCSCPRKSVWRTLLPVQYLYETSGCLTPFKPAIFVTKWVKRSLVSAAVALLTFWAVM